MCYLERWDVTTSRIPTLNKPISSHPVMGASLSGLESHAHFAACIKAIKGISDSIIISGTTHVARRALLYIRPRLKCMACAPWKLSGAPRSKIALYSQWNRTRLASKNTDDRVSLYEGCISSKRETHSDNRAQCEGACEDASSNSILQNCPHNGLCPESRCCHGASQDFWRIRNPYRSKALWSRLR